jgi:hypothetical protein
MPGEVASNICLAQLRGLDDAAVPAASRGVALGSLWTPALESGVSFAVAAGLTEYFPPRHLPHLC